MNERDEELNELYEFFYLAPIGMVRVTSDGIADQINPFMINLLMKFDTTFNKDKDIFKFLDQIDKNVVGKIKSLNKETRTLSNYDIIISNNQYVKKIKINASLLFGNKYIIIIEDLTDVYYSELEREKIQKELDDQKERLSQIGHVVRSVAHDLRNPIANIKTITQMLEFSSIEETKALFEENIPLILDEINGILSDLLDFTRAELPKFQIVESQLLNFHLKSKFEYMQKEFNIPIVHFFDENYQIECDEIKILRVFTNIITNALKALKSSNTKDPKIEVICKVKNNNLEITISDNGPGIPENLLDKLFDPFAFKSAYVGNGIGLPIVKNIVTKHNGTIKVDSKQGEGTTFYITIPLMQKKE